MKHIQCTTTAVLLIMLSRVFLAAVLELDTHSWQTVVMTSDGLGYLETAECIESSNSPTLLFRMPGYPVFLILLESIFSDEILASILLQQLMHLVIAIVAAQIAIIHKPDCNRMWVMLCVLCTPVISIHTFLLLPDTLFLMFCCLGTWFAVLGTMKRSFTGSVYLTGLSGFVLGIGALVKPILLYGFLPVSAYMLMVGRKSIKARLALVLVLVIAQHSVPSLWLLRNSLLFGYDRYTLQDGFELPARIAVLGGVMTTPPHEFKDSLETVYLRPDGTPDFERRDSVLMSMAVESFRRSPWRVIIPHIVSWPSFFKPGVQYFADVPVFQNNQRLFKLLKAIVFAISAGIGILFLFAAIAGGMRRRYGSLLALGSCWFVFTALSAGPLASNPRYGLPFMWLFSTTAALVTADLAQLFRRGCKSRIRPFTEGAPCIPQSRAKMEQGNENEPSKK
ncbi:MAG: hypothetical protein GYA36_18080 [Veillonellaceae bacterium]|nr:hypothetical protein [Veillonellaceae bacterium]